MEIKEINDKTIWEDFLLKCKQKTFLHAWNWGEFQQSLGNKVWHLGIFSQDSLISVALVIKHIAKRGSFLLVPHGPVMENPKSQIPNPKQIRNSKSEILNNLLNKLIKIAKEEKVDFIRVSPILERIDENNKLFKDLGFRLRPLHMHPESSWKLNIELSEKELFENMRKATRHSIKQAQKDNDLSIFQSFDIRDIEIFSKMHLEVVKNQKFVPFSLEYFQKEFLAFLPDNQIIVFFAKYSLPHQTKKDCAKLGHKINSDSPLWCGGKDKIIAASYCIFWSNRAFYHHAALLPEYKKIPASYFLQWEAIKEAKKRGCKIYDFWGYSDPKKNPKHPYSGPTFFKMGFGGYKEEYVKTQDFIISPKYWINYIIEVARRIRRGL